MSQTHNLSHIHHQPVRTCLVHLPTKTIPLNFLNRVARSMADSESLLTGPEPEPGGPSGALLRSRIGAAVGFSGVKTWIFA